MRVEGASDDESQFQRVDDPREDSDDGDSDYRMNKELRTDKQQPGSSSNSAARKKGA